MWRNNSSATNTVPAAPAGLSTAPSSNTITLSRNAASDSQTPSVALTYNLRVVTGSGGRIFPTTAADGGYRCVPRLGNVEHG